MDGAVDAFKKELAGLRTGRAATSLLEPITVEVYGNRVPLNQVGTIGVPEPRLITVQVWDAARSRRRRRRFATPGLGLNPQTEGQTIRVPIPDLSQERRQELAKVAHKYAEHARVAVRNVRRDGMEAMKKAEKKGDISQDD